MAAKFSACAARVAARRFPPDACITGTDRLSQNGPIRQLRKRSQFVAASKGKRVNSPAFSLLCVPVEPDEPGIGYTVTNRIGNSPQRNRIRRRLRAAAKTCALTFLPRHDYVLIGRRKALHTPFDILVTDLQSSLARIHDQTARAPERSQ